jgi:hypothetical protein
VARIPPPKLPPPLQDRPLHSEGPHALLSAIQALLRGEPHALDPAPNVKNQPEPQQSRDEHSALTEVCLARDGNRCAITGLYDMVKTKDPTRLDRASMGMKVPTACTYFLPSALGRFENEKPYRGKSTEHKPPRILAVSQQTQWNAGISYRSRRIWRALYR